MPFSLLRYIPTAAVAKQSGTDAAWSNEIEIGIYRSAFVNSDDGEASGETEILWMRYPLRRACIVGKERFHF